MSNAEYVIRNPVKGLFDPQKGYDSQVENHGSNIRAPSYEPRV